jgi:hypothetical protein
MAAKLANSPSKVATSSRHSVRIAVTYSAVRAPRRANGTPRASNSSRDHPTPTPSVSDHVLAGPQGREAGSLRAGGHGVDHVAPGPGADAERVQSEVHRAILATPPARAGVALDTAASHVRDDCGKDC